MKIKLTILLLLLIIILFLFFQISDFTKNSNIKKRQESIPEATLNKIPLTFKDVEIVDGKRETNWIINLELVSIDGIEFKELEVTEYIISDNVIMIIKAQGIAIRSNGDYYDFVK